MSRTGCCRRECCWDMNVKYFISYIDLVFYYFTNWISRLFCYCPNLVSSTSFFVDWFFLNIEIPGPGFMCVLVLCFSLCFFYFSHINYHSLSGRDESHSMFFYKHVRGQSHIDFCFFSVIRTLLGGWVSFKDAIQNNKINIDF